MQKNIIMKKLTVKEEEIMHFFWTKGALFVRELLDMYPDPKPHFNTLSTMVRTLESKGYIAHKVYGNTYQYYAVIDEDEFKNATLKNVISKYFENSYTQVVSALVKEEKLSIEELKQLISQIEKK